MLGQVYELCNYQIAGYRLTVEVGAGAAFIGGMVHLVYGRDLRGRNTYCQNWHQEITYKMHFIGWTLRKRIQ